MALSRHVSSDRLQYHGGEEEKKKPGFRYASDLTMTRQSEYFVFSLKESPCTAREPPINSRSFRNNARLGTKVSGNCVPPSVVAILEVTSIPRLKKRSTRPKYPRRVSDDMKAFRRMLVNNVKERRPVRYNSGISAFDVLMGPPDYVECEKNACYGDTVTSKLLRSRVRKAAKSFSAGESCAEDHPLLPTREVSPRPDSFCPDAPSVCQKGVNCPSPSSMGAILSSKLSAALRSAAETSVFKLGPSSIRFRDLAITDDNSAVSTRQITPPVPRCHVHEAILATEMQPYEENPRCLDKGPKCMLSIQMQTYPFLAETIARRQARRDNNTFLRVAVLEQNMRRRGKIRSNAPGRARASLPPRESSIPIPPSSAKAKLDTEKGNSAGCTIPRRWVGVSVDG